MKHVFSDRTKKFLVDAIPYSLKISLREFITELKNREIYLDYFENKELIREKEIGESPKNFFVINGSLDQDLRVIFYLIQDYRREEKLHNRSSLDFLMSTPNCLAERKIHVRDKNYSQERMYANKVHVLEECFNRLFSDTYPDLVGKSFLITEGWEIVYLEI
jgi:hypothetical protein